MIYTLAGGAGFHARVHAHTRFSFRSLLRVVTWSPLILFVTKFLTILCSKPTWQYFECYKLILQGSSPHLAVEDSAAAAA